MGWLQCSMCESDVVKLQHSITYLLQDKLELAPILLLRHILFQIHIIWFVFESNMFISSVGSGDRYHMLEPEPVGEISDSILIQEVDLELWVTKYGLE